MLYEVILEYCNSNPDPIELLAGDQVRTGELSNPDGPWPSWIHCVLDRTNKQGWVPAQILNGDGTDATVLADYTAREMTVAAGELVHGSNETNGWLWCVRIADQQSGWVPKENLLQRT